MAVSSGESGDVGPSSSGEVVPPISSGEIVPPVSSGETSNVLLSTANDSRFVIKKGEVSMKILGSLGLENIKVRFIYPYRRIQWAAKNAPPK